MRQWVLYLQVSRRHTELSLWPVWFITCVHRASTSCAHYSWYKYTVTTEHVTHLCGDYSVNNDMWWPISLEYVDMGAWLLTICRDTAAGPAWNQFFWGSQLPRCWGDWAAGAHGAACSSLTSHIEAWYTWPLAGYRRALVVYVSSPPNIFAYRYWVRSISFN